jgi:hypothetical protein
VQHASLDEQLEMSLERRRDGEEGHRDVRERV